MADKLSLQAKDLTQTEVGGTGNRNDFVSAVKFDPTILDTRLSRALLKYNLSSVKVEEWEIDLSKLDIRNFIARGTYSTVYKGVYDGQVVAVKVLDWGEDGMQTAKEVTLLRDSFRQEVAVWHKLDHPNVTKFVGASTGTSDLTVPSSSSSMVDHPARACCIVIEYLNGGTLKNFLFRHNERKLPFKTVVQLALDLSRGLSYLHSKKIVHRDIKSENMLLRQGSLKITDFSVARVEAQNPKDMTGTTGTLGYMAPEVLNGNAYDRKCDVYSFGICLWEIYCCEMPHRNLSMAEVSSAVAAQHLRPHIPRCCPAPFANIMRKCWDPNPNKRPNMDEVVSMLEEIDTSKGGGMIPDGQPSCLCFGTKRGP